jgi:hypothetical protein
MPIHCLRIPQDAEAPLQQGSPPNYACDVPPAARGFSNIGGVAPHVRGDVRGEIEPLGEVGVTEYRLHERPRDEQRRTTDTAPKGTVWLPSVDPTGFSCCPTSGEDGNDGVCQNACSRVIAPVVNHARSGDALPVSERGLLQGVAVREKRMLPSFVRHERVGPAQPRKAHEIGVG